VVNRARAGEARRTTPPAGRDPGRDRGGAAHLNKTKRDAKALASGLTGSGEFAAYEVYFKGNYMLFTMKEMRWRPWMIS
jgi:hypothetical protein